MTKATLLSREIKCNHGPSVPGSTAIPNISVAGDIPTWLAKSPYMCTSEDSDLHLMVFCDVECLS